ncbi:MAG: lysostaphin resistance A-like protein [Bacillota bacterium]
MLRVLWRLFIYLFFCLLFVYAAGWLGNAIGLCDPFLAGFAGITLATWTAVRLFDRGRLRDLGLAWHPARPGEVALGLGLPFFLMAGIFAAEWAAGWLLVSGFRPELAPLLYNLWVFVLVAWYEEIFARGYLFQTMLRALPPWAALLFSALFFAGLHALNPGATVPALFGVFLAGLVLGLACLSTRGLYLPVAFHFSWNFFQALFGFPVSGQCFPGLFRLVREGPAFYTGGPFGPEAGVLGFMALLVAGSAILFYAKGRGAEKRPGPSSL